MSEENMTKAITAVKELLEALNVVRVVYVDDANDHALELETVIVVATGLSQDKLLQAFPELGKSIPDDPAILRRIIRDKWDTLDKNTQEIRGKAILSADSSSHEETDSSLHEESRQDIKYASILGELISAEKLTSLTPSMWEQKKDTLINDSQTSCTIFLFDRDFTRTGGSTNDGIAIISELLGKNASTSHICGLITHTVTPETQQEEWLALSEKFGIPKDRFVVIPKLCLSEAPIDFAHLLKFTALSSQFTKLKEKAQEVIKAAAATAAGKVEEVSIYHLDHIVFQVSENEGLWEPDMLFRLDSLFHRIESRQLAHTDGTLEKLAATLRNVSKVPTNYQGFPTPLSTWKLQQIELYEFSEHINQYHFPLELGDIFEISKSADSKKYILLAQPCDLMVRSKGERTPQVHRVPIVELVKKKRQSNSNEDKQSNDLEEIPYFSESPDEIWFIKLKRISYVNVCILDLCIFDKNGEAKFISESIVPDGVRPTWKERYKILSKYFDKLIKQVQPLFEKPGDNNALKEFKRQNRESIVKSTFKDDLFSASLEKIGDDYSLRYDCKRVRRISHARAIGFLMSLTASIGRPGYDADFGKEINKS